jgi:hypothetical protein
MMVQRMTKDAALALIVLAVAVSGCGGEGGNACYSPTANVARAGQTGAQGCPCDPAVDKDVCVEGKALFCDYGHWSFGFDGPCRPIHDAGNNQDLISIDTSDVSSVHDVLPVDTSDLGGSRDVWSVDIGDVGSAVDVSPSDATDLDSTVDVSSVDADQTDSVDADLVCTIDSGCPAGATCKAGQCEACFTANLHPELATLGSTQGCPCDSSPGYGLCFKGIGIVCLYGRWMTVLDGPCMPMDTGGSNDAGFPGSGSGG